MTDPGWKYGISQTADKKKVKCNFCDKIVTGGVNRFKQHLARISGNVAACKKVPEDVASEMKACIEGYKANKWQKKVEDEEITSVGLHDHDDPEDAGYMESMRRKKGKQVMGDISKGASFGKPTKSSGIVDFIVRNPNPENSKSYKQMTLKVSYEEISREKVHIAISRFFYHNAIPFNAANSPYFAKMLDMVSAYGQMKWPSSYSMSGPLLQKEIKSIDVNLKEFKASWGVTGCTLMSDGWKDSRERTLINFLIYCPRGLYFIRSLDASDIVKDASAIFQMLDGIVEEVGENNVVQVVTDNGSNYKAAGRMLEEKRKHLFWTPCAAHCIDLILEDFVKKIRWVANHVEKGKKITKFIYNRSWVLNVLRKFTSGKEILRPGATRFATNFIALQSLLEQKPSIRRMFLFDEWINSRYSKLTEGKEVEDIVLDNKFWSKVQLLVKLTGSLVTVLREVDSDKPTMGFIFDEMSEARESIKRMTDHEEASEIFLTIVDVRWDRQLHHPLHAAAYFLNPKYQYRPDFSSDPQITACLIDCINRLEMDLHERCEATLQISSFQQASGPFGTDVAIHTRERSDPAEWWGIYGTKCPQLRKIAIRILIQTCTSSGCERNWSTFDQIHTKRRNRLTHRKLNDLVFVHYNVRLREKQLRSKPSNPIALNHIFLENPVDEWIIEEQTVFEDDEDDLHNIEEVGDLEEENISKESMQMNSTTQERNEMGPAITDLDDDLSDL